MEIQTLNDEDYVIQHDPGAHAITFSGSIRLQTMDDYAPIKEMLQDALHAAGPDAALLLDFRNLRFLNSSGINTISRFVIEARKQDKAILTVVGNQEIYWQQKSLTNLQRLWPKIKIDIQ